MDTVNKKQFVQPGWALSFLGCIMLVNVSFYLGQLSHFHSCSGAGVTNVNEPLLSFFAPSSLLHILSRKQCEATGNLRRSSLTTAMRDEEVIYVAGHPWLNRTCTRLPGCIRLQNDLYCVGLGIKLYSLTPYWIGDVQDFQGISIPHNVVSHWRYVILLNKL